MVWMTREERQLRGFMALSAIVYFAAGLAFALVPSWVLTGLNRLSRLVAPGLPEIPLPAERFWLALAFSLMMTMAALSYATFVNVRRNRGFVVALLISKLASSASAACFFYLTARHLAYLVISVVEAQIFLITLLFYLRANRAILRARKEYQRKRIVVPKSTGPATVVAHKGEDIFELLDRVLEQSGFYGVLEERHHVSGKTRDEFSVAIKPNFMLARHKKDKSTYTDPDLVGALVDRICARGFKDVSIVESRNNLAYYYKNRQVARVAEYLGYSGNSNCRIVDLTGEMEPYDYGGRFGRHYVGPTWRDADFRVSFAKNRTHVFCHYGLTLENIYGTLPVQNKLREYHSKREYDWPVIESLKHFPVHFGLIDAIYSADGNTGVTAGAGPNHTRTIIGGENLIAVDWVGARKMGLNPDDPRVGRFLPLAVEAFGKPEVNWSGDRSFYMPWKNVDEFFIQSLDTIEESYAYSDWWFSALSGMDRHFPFKIRALPALIMRKLLGPLKRIFYRYDYL